MRRDGSEAPRQRQGTARRAGPVAVAVIGLIRRLARLSKTHGIWTIDVLDPRLSDSLMAVDALALGVAGASGAAAGVDVGGPGVVVAA